MKKSPYHSLDDAGIARAKEIFHDLITSGRPYDIVTPASLNFTPGWEGLVFKFIGKGLTPGWAIFVTFCDIRDSEIYFDLGL